MMASPFLPSKVQFLQACLSLTLFCDDASLFRRGSCATPDTPSCEDSSVLLPKHMRPAAAAGVMIHQRQQLLQLRLLPTSQSADNMVMTSADMPWRVAPLAAAC